MDSLNSCCVIFSCFGVSLLAWLQMQREKALEEVLALMKAMCDAGRECHLRICQLERDLAKIKEAGEVGASQINHWIEEIETISKEVKRLRAVNDAEHHAMFEHQKCTVRDLKKLSARFGEADAGERMEGPLQ